MTLEILFMVSQSEGCVWNITWIVIEYEYAPGRVGGSIIGSVPARLSTVNELCGEGRGLMMAALPQEQTG